MAVTIIRHQAIGNKVGVVITNSWIGPGLQNHVKFEATFQLYMQSKALDSLLLIYGDVYDAEQGAIDKFDAWVTEAELLVAAGDMG